MFDKLIDVLIQFIGYFQFWRVIPVNKRGVLIRLGKNPRVLEPGWHWVFPFEIDHIKAVIVEPEIVSTHSVHLTTTDKVTCVAAPVLRYRIVDPIKWLYGVNDAPTNLHDTTRLYTSESGKIKIEIAIAKGKKEYDKKESIKARDIEREMKRERL